LRNYNRIAWRRARRNNGLFEKGNEALGLIKDGEFND